MCGIAGILARPGRRPEPEHLRALAAALAHRGPDDEGLLDDGPVGLVHRRLAILDLSAAGHQPLANEDHSVHVVYNGQLFGFEALRQRLVSQGHRFRSRTDTEILVHLYEERGLELASEIEGMFAFALWDAPRQRLLLARDRLGIKPLYYACVDGTLAFASELQALLRVPFVPREVDPAGVFSFLYQSSVPGTRSVLRGVHQLQPGHCLVVEAGTARSWSYWQPPAGGVAEPSFAAAVEGLEARLRSAVRSHLVADVPVGTFLSGGLDSAAVTLHAREALPGTLHTFSVRFRSKAHDEGSAARATAAALCTEHHELELGPECAADLPGLLAGFDEPFAVSSSLALLHLARLARQHVKVVLTGDGADEVLGGYPWRHEPDSGQGASSRTRLRGLALSAVRAWRGSRAGGPGVLRDLRARVVRQARRPGERYAEIVSAFTPEQMAELASPEWRRVALEAWTDGPVPRAFAASGPGVSRDDVERRLRTDLATTLVDEMLTKVDRTTMAVGLEARVPFLDRELVSWALAQPARYKLERGIGKRMLRASLADRLPDLARRPKHGFDVPLGPWLRGPLRELVTDTLAPARIQRRGWLAPTSVGRLLDAHLAGRGDHARQVLSLLALELWLERLAEGARRPLAAVSRFGVVCADG